MAEVFNFQCERRDDDYRALRRQVTRESGMRPYQRGFSWSCGAVAAVIAIVLMGTSTQWGRNPIGAAQFGLLFLSFFGAWWLLLWLLEPVVADRFPLSLRIFRAPLMVTLNSDGIQLTSAFVSQSLMWSAISDIFETRTHVFLRIDGTSVGVIPKRAFEMTLQAAEFVKEANDRLAAVRTRQA